MLYASPDVIAESSDYALLSSLTDRGYIGGEWWELARHVVLQHPQLVASWRQLLSEYLLERDIADMPNDLLKEKSRQAQAVRELQQQVNRQVAYIVACDKPLDPLFLGFGHPTMPLIGDIPKYACGWRANGGYVYGLCPPTLVPFYVGVGTNGRVHQHERDAARGHTQPRHIKIRALWVQGEPVRKVILAAFPEYRDAQVYEVEWHVRYPETAH